MGKKRFVIIGGDAAGMSAASLAKRRQPDLEIEAYEMGDYTSYGACGMPYYVSGDVPQLDDLVVVTPEEFEHKRGIRVFMRHRAETIHPHENRIEVRDLGTGILKEVPYDDLLIATGAEPVIPARLDMDLPGVFALRGLPDADGIRRYIGQHSFREAIIVGTGYIGMEMAEALATNGLNVTVLGRRPQVLPLFEQEISEIVAQELEKRHIRLMTRAEAESAVQDRDGRLAVTLANGERLTTDLLMVGAGVRPRSRLAEEAGLALGVKKAIQVDRTGRTSSPHIWSAGDCAEAYHALLKKNTYIPLALTANRQGRVVGNNVVGIPSEFPGILGTTICKVFDLTVARTGLSVTEAQAEGYDVAKVVVNGRSRAHYYPGSASITTMLIVERGNQKLWGAQMVGADGVAHRINTWAAALGAGLSLEQIYGLDLAYAPPFSPVWDPVLVASEIAMKRVK